MKRHIPITTTNSFEGNEISSYINIVSTNVVVGTNFFSDFGASLTDLFGGYSNTYQSKLQGIYKTAIRNLQEQTLAIRGDAIVGLKMDFDEISGKGKSMFMVSALGMAVKLKQTEEIKIENDNHNIISSEELANAIIKLHIKSAIKNNTRLSKEQWDFLLRFPFSEVIEGLLAQYLRININFLNDGEQDILDNFERYLSMLDSEVVINMLYEKITDNTADIISILNNLKLFSPQKVLCLLHENANIAIECLKIDKEYYVKSDLVEMTKIIELIDQTPNEGKIEVVSGIMSKGKEKFICGCGAKHSLETDFCNRCGKNIKGHSQKQVNLINTFKEKTFILSELLEE